MTPQNLEFMTKELLKQSNKVPNDIMNTMPQSLSILTFDKMREYGLTRKDIDLGQEPYMWRERSTYYDGIQSKMDGTTYPRRCYQNGHNNENYKKHFY